MFRDKRQHDKELLLSLHIKLFITQEADRPDCSTSMPKVVVGVARVLKVFSWGFIYKFHKKIGLGPKTSVKPG